MAPPAQVGLAGKGPVYFPEPRTADEQMPVENSEDIWLDFWVKGPT